MLLYSLLLSIILSCSAEGDPPNTPPPAMMTGGSQNAETPPPCGCPASQQEVLWRKEVLDVLTQLLQVQRDAAAEQSEVVKLLGMLGTQGSQQILDLQNVARHQSLLVENHQALLLQTSRIGSQLQEITRKPADVHPPTIRLYSNVRPNGTEVVLTAGSSFALSCHGNASVRWSTTAFRLMYQEQLPNPVEVKRSDPRHTGTYRCGYADQSLKHLETWIHLFVRDPSKLSSVFVTPRNIPILKEGEDFLFKCLLTDPSVTNLSLRREGEAGERGRGLPPGMKVTLDPRRGALIRQLEKKFNGPYVCSGWRNGEEFKSNRLDLLVVPKLRHPPSLSVSQQEFIRLEGEAFSVICMTSNPSHLYNISWTPRVPNAIQSSQYRNNRLYINSTLSVAAVTSKQSGPYTCTAINEAGVARATTHLTVLDRPYLRMYLKQLAAADLRGMQINGTQETNVSRGVAEAVSWEMVANVTAKRVRDNGDSGVNCSSSSSSRVEVYEGRDVTLTFAMEAYPLVSKQRWVTPTHVVNGNEKESQYKQTYTTNGYRSEASLLLQRVRQEDKGHYSLHFSNSFFRGIQDVDLRVFRSPSTVVTLENDTLTCSSSGYPPPTILWFICPGVRDTCGDDYSYQVSSTEVTSREDEEEVTESLPRPASPGDDVTVECVAFSHMGESRDVFISREPPTIFTPVLIAAVSAASVLLLLLLVVSYKLKKKPKYEIRWKIIESTDGNNYTFVDPSQLPYNQKWEFPRDKLRLGPVLGSGAFGKVVEATAYGLGTNNATRVAVKMLKPSAHSEEREALMSELKILSHLGYHDNIVNLLGACTLGGPMLMITEYCSHGDLLNFLRAHAQDFMASILSMDESEEEVFYKNLSSQHVRLRSDSGISCCSEYQEMQPVLSPGQKQTGVQTDCLTVGDLMRFSYQVAQGLDFLSNRNCIHRDVAARNVLLTDRCVAKICDFGLARDIRNDDSYIVQGNARLPVKWMAPESIFQCVYTVQSDVWSYGVLLWEIFSLGKSPYPNVIVDTNFYKMIKDGRHMGQPDFAPAEMYQLMTLCWSLEPTVRPTFKMIGQLISRLLPSTKDSCPQHREQTAYRNIDECREEEEEEEVKGEEERVCCEEDEEEEEEEAGTKNIYQLS